MKKYVRFITSSCLTLCRRCNSNLLFIQGALRKPLKWKYWTLKRSLQPLQIFHKIGVLKNFAKIHRETLVLKLKLRLTTLFKRDSSLCVFLCVLRNFRTRLEDCFYHDHIFRKYSCVEGLYRDNYLLVLKTQGLQRSKDSKGKLNEDLLKLANIRSIAKCLYKVEKQPPKGVL